MNSFVRCSPAISDCGGASDSRGSLAPAPDSPPSPPAPPQAAAIVIAGKSEREAELQGEIERLRRTVRERETEAAELQDSLHRLTRPPAPEAAPAPGEDDEDPSDPLGLFSD